MPDDYTTPHAVSDSAFIFSYSGEKIGLDQPAPSFEDIAVSLGRICRFTGQCTRFYPVLLHSLVVSDIVQKMDKRSALLHDAAEMFIGDIPTPFKSPEMKQIERRLSMQLLSARLTPEQQLCWVDGGYKRVKLADEEAFFAEIAVLGNRGLREWATETPDFAASRVEFYLRSFTVEDCVRPDGFAVIEFIRRCYELD